MHKIILPFILVFGITAVIGQSDLFELVTKGKKQGVKSTSSEAWLIPMAKQVIIEPQENLFLTIDEKNQTVQGYYHDAYFDKKSQSANQLFFGDAYGGRNQLYFENEILDIRDHSITRPKYMKFNSSIQGPGCGFFGELMILAARVDTAGLFMVEVSKGKDGLVQRFDNVLYTIKEDLLLIARTKPKKYDTVYQKYYDVEAVEIYEILGNKLTKKGAFEPTQENEFERVLGHIYGYGYEPVYPSPKVSYGDLLNDDYRKDSADKYSLILETGAGILFANSKDQFHLSIEDEWEEISGEYYSKQSYKNGGNGYFAMEKEGDVFIFKSHLTNTEIQLLDENGQEMYTEFGDPVYQEIEDEQFSGVYNMSTNSWIVPNEYADVLTLNNEYIAEKYLFSPSKEDKYSLDRTIVIDIYDKDGGKLHSLQSPNEVQLLEKVYSGAKVEELENSYGMYSVSKGSETAIIDLSVDYLRAYEVASFDDGVIPESFNTSSHNYVTHVNDKFFTNHYDVEIGVTSFEVKNGYRVTTFHENDGYGFMTTVHEDKSKPVDGQILCGLEVLNEDQVIIYNNDYPSTFEQWNEFGEPGGFYDEYGNNYSLFHYDRAGKSSSGIFNTKTKNWDLQPIYNSIKQSNSGYNAFKRSDKINGELVKEENGYIIKTSEYYPVLDSTSLDIYNNSFELIKENVAIESFLEDPENFRYFLEKGNLGKCIRAPKMLSEELHFMDTHSNFWFQSSEGITVVRKEVFNKGVEVLIGQVDWVHESEYYLYALRNDSLVVKDKSTLDVYGEAVVPVSSDFEILETLSEVFIVSEKGAFEVPPIEFGKITAQKSEKVILDDFHLKIIGTENVITCKHHNISELFMFDEIYGDETYITFKEKNDFVWVKKGEKWMIKLNSNTITQTPFGYVVDSTSIQDDFSLPMYFLNEDHELKEEFKGGAQLYSNDFNPISGIHLTDFYSISPVDGRDDLFVINYADETRPELMGVISISGKTAVEACDYKVEGNTLTYSPCQDAGFGGVTFDANGNQVFKTIEIK